MWQRWQGRWWRWGRHNQSRHHAGNLHGDRDWLFERDDCDKHGCRHGPISQISWRSTSLNVDQTSTATSYRHSSMAKSFSLSVIDRHLAVGQTLVINDISYAMQSADANMQMWNQVPLAPRTTYPRARGRRSRPSSPVPCSMPAPALYPTLRTMPPLQEDRRHSRFRAFRRRVCRMHQWLTFENVFFLVVAILGLCQCRRYPRRPSPWPVRPIPARDHSAVPSPDRRLSSDLL